MDYESIFEQCNMQEKQLFKGPTPIYKSRKCKICGAHGEGVKLHSCGNREYICDKCGQQYKPQPVQWSMGMHFPTRRHMKCPHCGNWGWHKRVRVPDDRDFI